MAMNNTHSADVALGAAATVVTKALIARTLDAKARAVVRSFFDRATFTASHVVHDPATRRAAIIDPVLDFDAAGGRTRSVSADATAHAISNCR